MPDIFISYKREDQPFAETLRDKLLAWGYSVWMDVYDIPDGAYWPDAIDAGLNSAHTVIGVMSPQAVQSRNVKNEWDWAIVNGRRLLLMMLEPVDPVPMNYVSISYIDATTDHAAAFERVHAALDAPILPLAVPDDPYLPYLQVLYERINTVLAQKIIKLDADKEPRPIDLISRRTEGAVEALFEKREEIDPLFAVQGIAAEPAPAWEVGDFREAFEHFDGRILLLGEPGAGKTITLLHFGRDAVVQRIQNPAAPLPILALIPTWDASKQPPLIEWVEASYGAPEHARQVIENGRALLLLDGLDELGGEREEKIPEDPKNPESKEQIVRYDPRQRFIRALADLNPILNSPTHGRSVSCGGCVVTCRVKDYKSIDAKIALNGAVTLQNLTDEQMQHYLDELPDLWAAMQVDDQLRNIARTPLLLSFFAFAYRDMTPEDAAALRDLTDSPGDLRDAIFERFVYERYMHEERRLQLRGEKMPFSRDKVVDVLSVVAWDNITSWRAEENVLQRRDFAFVMIHETEEKNRLSSFLSLALQLNFIAQVEYDTWRFSHLLFRDYFAFGYAVHLMSNKNLNILRDSIYALGKIGDARAFEVLITALSDHDADSTVRRSAAIALGEIGDSRAVEPLIALLSDIHEDVRHSAADALGMIGDTRALEPLTTALTDTVGSVRRSAVTALGQIGDARAMAPLLAALRDDAGAVRASAADALGRIGDVRAVDLLTDALGDDDWLVRESAVGALIEIGAPAVDLLVAALGDDDGNVRRNAVRALGEVGDAHAVDSLIAVLGDDDSGVRRNAAAALARIGAPAVEPLLATLDGDDITARGNAAYALGKLGDARAVNPLVAALLDDSGIVRKSVAEALGKLGHARAVDPLVAALLDDYSGVRASAANALAKIGTPEALAAVEEWRASQQSDD